MKDRLIGIDMNGWHDFAVRSWLKDRDGINQPIRDGYTVDGGTLSRVIRAGDDFLEIGGPRAQMALHGRGPGWGEFGDETRRSLLRRADDPNAWGTSMRELGSDPRIAVLAIPDDPSMDELSREHRLEALRFLHARRSMLVWSSVALALNECNADTLVAGQKLGIVEVEAEGFRVQILDIIERDGLLTPQRRHIGRKVASSLGFGEREQIALDRVSATVSSSRTARALALADLPAMLAMAKPGEMLNELVRLENGDWFEAIGDAPKIEWDVSIGELAPECSRIVLHGPCKPGLLQDIASEFIRHCTIPIVVAPPDSVARGAYLAAQRLHLGQPPWFDYLPDIKTIVQEPDGIKVDSLSLVGSDDVAEAGKLWRSAKPVPMIWQAGSERIEVWLKKEDDPKPRFSSAVVQTSPNKSKTVQLVLEQEPAQGRAKLRIMSETWPELRDHPAVVDWDAGKTDERGRDWDTIIASFRVRPPVVPERVVLPAHNALWYSEESGGLAAALRGFKSRNYTPTYKALSARWQVYFDQPNHPNHKRVYYAIDSDGGRPSGVKDEDWERLLNVISQAEADFISGTIENNHALGVLSWCFRLCPKSVWPIVFRALKEEGEHPVFPGWRTMYPQALGRIASGEAAYVAAVDYLNSLNGKWNTNQQACAAFLLSRNDDIFDFLDQDSIKLWACVAKSSLEVGVKDGFSGKQYYTPVLIAGLLRWRRREPQFLTPGNDILVDEFSDLLTAALQRPDLNDKQRTGYEMVQSALHDKGVRPDLLQNLFDLTFA